VEVFDPAPTRVTALTLFFEYGVCPNVSAQSLGCGFLDVWSPCHPSVEGDTQIFNTIYKRDVPSIWLDVVLRYSTSSREIDRLSLAFVDLYIPVLIP
jgi:hypothetical protein